jgi:hypothetical protein
LGTFPTVGSDGVLFYIETGGQSFRSLRDKTLACSVATFVCCSLTRFAGQDMNPLLEKQYFLLTHSFCGALLGK